jgi:glucose uptake protein GlcU
LIVAPVVTDMSVTDRVGAADSQLSDEQKFRAGSILLLIGAALIALLVWLDIAQPLQIVIGVMAVALMVAGTLGVGTSGTGDRRTV